MHNVGAYLTDRFLKEFLKESFCEVRPDVVRTVERTVLKFSTVRSLPDCDSVRYAPPPCWPADFLFDPGGRTVLKFSTVRFPENLV